MTAHAPTSPFLAPPAPMTAVPTIARVRLVGPDVVRAVALIGVCVMNYHGYLINRGGELSSNFWGRFFHPWEGPLSTRFAATFVLTAGVGVTLLTRRAVADRRSNPGAITAKRWTLVRRGLVLYGFGLIFYEIWSGSILPYYGAMFVVAAFLFTLATPWLAGIGVAAALAGAGIHWWVWERAADGRSTTWLTNPPTSSPRGLLFDMFINGTHPLFPWLAFLCAGMILGRMLRSDSSTADPARPEWWAPAALGIGLTLFGLATLLSDGLGGADATDLAAELASRHPFDRGLLYTVSALGTALTAFTLIYTIANRFARSAIVQLLAHAGQMSLTLYVLHAVVFNFVVNWQGWIEPAGLDLALTFAAGFWIVAIFAGSLWHRQFGTGPVEWLYRKLGA
ncbi:MAG TPA: DUF418 domain-containing protein [Desertimonas sp.]|nr:DUF418 domain-containing protein [Desertimonas sp.]